MARVLRLLLIECVYHSDSDPKQTCSGRIHEHKVAPFQSFIIKHKLYMFEGIIIYLSVIFFFALWRLCYYVFKKAHPAYRSSKLLLHIFFVSYLLASVLVIIRIVNQ